jgi:energy-coupling factor transport system permease protein
MSLFEGLKFRSSSSKIHLLDPRAKFFYVCILFVTAILFNELIPLLLIFLIQIPIVLMARIKSEWLRSMRGSLLFSVIIFATNAVSSYFYGSQEPLYSIIERSLAMTVRFIVLIESFSIFFLTTSPDHLGLALQQSGIPYDFCFAFTTAVRFIPVLAEEAETIMDAQKARGLELEKGNFLRKIRNYIPILVPLIVSAIRRSLELAEAMESRAWGASPKRTNLYELKIKRGDYYLIILSSILLLVSIYVRTSILIPSISEILLLSN